MFPKAAALPISVFLFWAPTSLLSVPQPDCSKLCNLFGSAEDLVFYLVMLLMPLNLGCVKASVCLLSIILKIVMWLPGSCWWEAGLVIMMNSNFGILWIKKTELPLRVAMWEKASWAFVSHTGRRNFSGTNIHFSFSPPAASTGCYSPSSPVQILESSNYFFPDFQLYSGRHEASALTVETNSSIREKVGKSYWYLC